MLRLDVVVSHLGLLGVLEHVVGPLGAAASLAVHEASPAGHEGPPAPPAVIHPGFLAVAVVMLQMGQNET